MAKGSERWLFLYDDQSRQALIDLFHRYADDPELNFSSADAALLTEKVREQAARPELSREMGRV